MASALPEPPNTRSTKPMREILAGYFVVEVMLLTAWHKGTTPNILLPNACAPLGTGTPRAPALGTGYSIVKTPHVHF